MKETLNEIEGFQISKNKKSNRIIDLYLKDEFVEKLIFPFKRFDIIALEYKPFTRFTLAKNLDDLTQNKLSKLINSILKDRSTGCFVLKTNIQNKKIDENFLVKLSTAITHLIGAPNHDSMSGKYYARFFIKHEDDSDSYLRKAYTNMDLHTDGTYVNEDTDWILMTKIEEKNSKGGETVLLHLDDLENLKELSEDPIGRQNFIWSSPKSKNVGYKVEHPVFTKDKEDNINISYIDQFPEPQNIKQGTFLQRLSDALEESDNKIVTELPTGSSVVTNNHFWLHGRKPFKINENLSRELLRIRGSFTNI